MQEPCIVLITESKLFDLFPNGMVPVTSQVPIRFSLACGAMRSGYLIDGTRLDSETMQSIAERIAEINGARVNDILETVLREGVPVLLEFVAVHPCANAALV